MKPHALSTISPLIVLVAAAVITTVPSAANASLLDLVGVNQSVDHAVDRMQELIDRANNAALAIEAQTNEDVTARIDQVRQIAADFESQIIALEKNIAIDANTFAHTVSAIAEIHEKNILGLETKFMNDLSAKIREVECTSDRILNEQLKGALGRVGAILGTHELVITPPVLYQGEHTTCDVLWSCRVTRTFELRDPFSETYKEAQTYLEDRLAAVQDNTPSQSIIDTYDLLGDLAKRATCHTFANTNQYENDFVRYSTIVRKWNDVLSWRAQ